MMTEFERRRRDLEKRQSAVPGAPPAVYAEPMVKGSRSRLYRIDIAGHGRWRAVVYFGSAIHRTQILETRLELKALQAEFGREVGELLEDGWRRDP
jgi:hypothetical protein